MRDIAAILEIRGQMKDPAAIIGEINSLYRELFTLELGASRPHAEVADHSLKEMETAMLKTQDESQARREEIMSTIMQLTHEYVQIVMRIP